MVLAEKSLTNSANGMRVQLQVILVLLVLREDVKFKTFPPLPPTKTNNNNNNQQQLEAFSYVSLSLIRVLCSLHEENLFSCAAEKAVH